MFKPNSIILYVADISVSTAFYQSVLKALPIETFDDFTVFALQDNMILGLQAKDAIDPKAQPAFGGFELCLSDITPEEVDAIYQDWKEKEIPIILEPVHLDFGYTFVAVDPDGHRLRICATDTSQLTG